jgi:hypothetical protein
MIGLLFYAMTLPIRAIGGLAGAAGRSGRRRPRGRYYSHGYCTIAHRSVGAAERCAETARYRREEARAIARKRQAIAEHNARLARQAADRAERRAHREAFRRKHPVATKMAPYLATVIMLALIAGAMHLTHAAHPTLLVIVSLVSFFGWLIYLGLRMDDAP